MRLLLTILLLSCLVSAHQVGEANSSPKLTQGQHGDEADRSPNDPHRMHILW